MRKRAFLIIDVEPQSVSILRTSGTLNCPNRLLKNGTGRKLPSFRSFLSEAV